MERLLFAEYPVRHVPNVQRVALEKRAGVLLATIYERVDGRTAISSYPNYLFTYYRNNEKLKETREPFLDLVAEGVSGDGLFRVLVSVADE